MIDRKFLPCTTILYEVKDTSKKVNFISCLSPLLIIQLHVIMEEALSRSTARNKAMKYSLVWWFSTRGMNSLMMSILLIINESCKNIYIYSTSITSHVVEPRGRGCGHYINCRSRAYHECINIFSLLVGIYLTLFFCDIAVSTVHSQVLLISVSEGWFNSNHLFFWYHSVCTHQPSVPYCRQSLSSFPCDMKHYHSLNGRGEDTT